MDRYVSFARVIVFICIVLPACIPLFWRRHKMEEVEEEEDLKNFERNENGEYPWEKDHNNKNV